MEAKDLRIGNYIKDHNGDVGKVSLIAYNYIYLTITSEVTRGETEIEGIPLTEEWFLKFGFTFVDDELGAKFYSKQVPNSISEILISNKGHFTLKSEDSYWYMRCYKDPKHVHQLQNLYFALTGEELEIKNNGNN